MIYFPSHNNVPYKPLIQRFNFSNGFDPNITAANTTVIAAACTFKEVLLTSGTHLLITMYKPVARMMSTMHGFKSRRIAWTYLFFSRFCSAIITKGFSQRTAGQLPTLRQWLPKNLPSCFQHMQQGCLTVGPGVLSLTANHIGQGFICQPAIRPFTDHRNCSVCTTKSKTTHTQKNEEQIGIDYFFAPTFCLGTSFATNTARLTAVAISIRLMDERRWFICIAIQHNSPPLLRRGIENYAYFISAKTIQ